MNCTRCGRTLPDLSKRDGDPFCSTTCARKTYGTYTETETDKRLTDILRPDRL